MGVWGENMTAPTNWNFGKKKAVNPKD